VHFVSDGIFVVSFWALCSRLNFAIFLPNALG